MVEKALTALQNKELVLYPTDTVWGIGGDATDPSVVKKIYALKQREDSKALIVLVNSITMLKKYVENVPESALLLLEEDRPTTLIYEKGKNLAPNLLGQDGSIGIRIPKHDFCTEVITRFGKPLISTSANISGQPTPKHFESISKEIIKGVDYCVPYFESKATLQPSRVIKIEADGSLTLLRP